MASQTYASQGVDTARPEARHRSAYRIVFWIAALNITLGLIAALFRVAFLQSMGIGLFSALVGLVLLVLGCFARRRSVAALVLAIALFALDGLAGILLPLLTEADWPALIAGLVGRIVLIVPMVRGVGAIRTLESREERTKSRNKAILVVVAVLSLLCAGTCGLGVPLALVGGRILLNRVMVTEPERVVAAARTIATYELPAGHREKMVIDAFVTRALYILPEAPSPGAWGAVFMLVQVPERWAGEDELGQQIRAAIEQQWQTPMVTVERTQKGEATICGRQVPLLVYEGIDEDGDPTRQVTSAPFDVNGNLTYLVVLGPIEGWDQAQVDAFVRSIR